jgi:hypothetical protein
MWEAYIEKPDGNVELLKSYKTKPSLREVSALVRDEVRNVITFVSQDICTFSTEMPSHHKASYQFCFYFLVIQTVCN